MARANDPFVEYARERLEPVLGPVRARPMFGGHGLYSGDIMFALISDATLYLKIDEQTEPRFVAADLSRFVYDGHTKPQRMSYCQAPEDLLDDRDVAAEWCELALAAARRSRRR